MKFNSNGGTPPSPAAPAAGEEIEPAPYSAHRATKFSVEETESALLLREVKKVLRRVVELEIKIEEIEKQVEGVRQATKKQEVSQEDYNLFRTMEKATVKRYLHELLNTDDAVIMDVYNNLARVREAHKNTNVSPLKESKEVNDAINLKPL